MTYLQLTVFLPVKIVFFFLETGFCQEQVGTCRPFCTGSECISLNQERVDFKTAKEACHERNGELMTFQTETDENILNILVQELYGNFWIGLCLPDGACSNLSAPLRGYEWTSGSKSSFIPSVCTWNDSFRVCSQHCVSLSNNRRLMERLCTEMTDGYLCKMKHKDSCKMQKISDRSVFKSSKGCSVGPCQHVCKEVQGGYRCFCFEGYIQDSNDPRQCKMYCGQEKCPAICEKDTCSCPDGYLLLTENVCEDINECSMDWCAQDCKNTFGSFVCSCREGYVLKDQVKCIKAAYDKDLLVTTPIAIGSAKPAANNNTSKDSSVAAGGFLWIWILLVLAVVGFVIVIRFYAVKHQRGREQNLNQASMTPEDNIEC
ncbi:thrombomodulin [Labrus mixtus]|uniref:thrombomodulin n=1 Tax=Labrus mixtus TaxID=508554 RepID=UPI0029C004F3|nr:thrombomodulin [Labrus mixtus]